ncbi:MAG TPA: hypothetical protein VGE52_10285 [Pirellulales bacterium]
MSMHARWRWAAVSLLLTTVGCAHAGRPAPTCSTVASTTETREPVDLPVVQRGSIIVASNRLPSLEEVAQAAPLDDDHVYRALTAQQAQCLAVERSSIAALLDRERQALGAQYSAASEHLKERVAPVVALQQQILLDAAVEVRNREATAALERYFNLAGGEAKRRLLDQSTSVLEAAEEQVGRLVDQGLKPEGAGEQLYQQRLKNGEQQLELEQTLASLTRGLNDQLDLGLGFEERIWPAVQLDVQLEMIDRQAAVDAALANNPQLVLLRNVERRMHGGNVEGVRGALQTVNPLLGASIPLPLCGLQTCLLKLQDDCSSENADAGYRKAQLRDWIASTERTVERDVLDAIDETQRRLRQIAVARQRLASWNEEIGRIGKRIPLGQDTFVDDAEANLERLRIENDIVDHVVAWHVARVKVRAAQGRLVAECGYGSDSDCR